MKAQVQSEKPNIILIITDDQGIGDVGYMGNPFVKTPNIDQLAAKSVRFTNFMWALFAHRRGRRS